MLGYVNVASNSKYCWESKVLSSVVSYLTNNLILLKCNVILMPLPLVCFGSELSVLLTSSKAPGT